MYLKPGDIRDNYRLFKQVTPVVEDRIEQGGPIVRTISVQDENVKIDGCGGPVFIRLVVHAQINTGKDVTTQSTYTVDAYSDIRTL